MIKLAKANNPIADFELLDCRSVNDFKKTFDGIICGFIIPYLSKEECFKLINDSFLHLNKDGVIYLSVIEGDYQKSAYETSSDGKHSVLVHYYDEYYLNKALHDCGFHSISFMRKQYKKADGTDTVHLIGMAIKK